MAQSNASQSSWMRDGAAPPQPQLRDTIAALVRARRLQLSIDYAFIGISLGLVVATVAVLVARLVAPSYAPLPLIGFALAFGVGVALVCATLRRTDALDVAIRADLALRLKQRFSTAWEYMQAHDDSALAERLAAQAVKAGLPARPQLVFPLRINRWGRLAPLAAMALLLVSVFDLDRLHAPAARQVDERVVNEGQRLGAFGREMHARATRDQLPHTAKQAEELERVATRMQSGALTRNESLGLLRQLARSLEEARSQLLPGENRKHIASLRRPDGTDGSAVAPVQDPREMLDRMLRGLLSSDDTQALKDYLSDPTRSGIPRPQAEDAMKQHQSGDDRAIRDILEKLAQIDQARKEQDELRRASAHVRRAQENLDEQAQAQGGRGAAAERDDNEDSDESADRGTLVPAKKGMSGDTSRGASRYGAQSDSSVAIERQAAAAPSAPDASSPILKPQGQIRDGEELVTQGQVLPRSNRPSVENVPMKAEFASQVEEALSKEHYPEQSKAFIRRYFLNLSQGNRPREPQSGGQ